MNTLTQTENLAIAEAEQQRLPTVLARERYGISVLEDQARQLIDTHAEISHDRWEIEPRINARTSLFEELTAKGHLSRVVFDCDVDEANSRTLQRLLNAWSDALPEWEMKRRFYEIVEELTVQLAWQEIQAGQLPEDTLILTISDYPEMATEREAVETGYRSLNAKGMVRATQFERAPGGSWRRVIEQVSRSNSNDASSARLLAEIGDSGYEMGSIGRLSNQIITTKREHPDGVVDAQRRLDSLAGPGIIYGEVVAGQNPALPGYGELREVSRRREEQLENYIDRLAEFERQLNLKYKSGLMSYEQKLQAIHKERTDIVNEICLLNPAYAKDARGELSAKYFERAAMAMSSGNDSAAGQYLESAISTADPLAAAVCGGGGSTPATPGTKSESTSQQAARIYQKAKEERKNWKWSEGYCLDPLGKCKNKGKRVKVGPCSVCEHCQDIYDGKSEKVDVFEPIKKEWQRYKEQEEIRRLKIGKLQLARKLAEQESYQKAA